MASINIPGRVQGENYHIRGMESIVDDRGFQLGLDLTFQNDRTGQKIVVKLSAAETYSVGKAAIKQAKEGAE